MRVRRTADRESGASLILVLVALTVFGLLVPILGQFGSANGVSGYIVKGLRFDRYAADNGVREAIALAQTDRTMGRAYVACPNVTSSMNVGSTAFQRTATVSCKGFAGSGEPAGDSSTPAYAVLGLDPVEHSIDVDSAGRLKTSGPWWANGNPGKTSADIHGVTIDARADLFGAQGGCREADNAHIYAAPKRCNSGQPVDNTIPASTPNLNGVAVDPPTRAEDACSSIPPSGVVELQPGIHWNRPWLNALSGGECPRPVLIHLLPGVHYFDFDFYERSRSDNKWQIGGSGSFPVTVVGGNLSSGTDAGNAYSRAGHANSATAPGTCDPGSEGVELVLGSQSNITVASPAHMELCPREIDPGAQHVAIIGSGDGARPVPHGVGPGVPVKSVGATEDPRDRFTWKNAPTPLAPITPIQRQECSSGRDCGPPEVNYSEGIISGQGRGEATVTMDIPNPFTKNDRLESLQVKVSHRESENGGPGNGENGKDRIKEMWFDVTGLGALRECRDRRQFSESDDWSQDTVPCDIRDAKFPLPDRTTVPTLTVTLHITTTGSDRGSVTVDLDQVALTGTATAPQPRKQECDCDALFVDNNRLGNAAAAYVWGTVVLPNADVNEDFGGSTTFRLARGVIARRFKLENLASDPNFIPVSLPNGGKYTDRIVEFEAKVGTKTKLRARVVFPDPVGSTAPPGSPLRAPEIKVWDTHP